MKPLDQPTMQEVRDSGKLPEPFGVGKDRRTRSIGESRQRVRIATVARVGADHDHWTLRIAQEVEHSIRILHPKSAWKRYRLRRNFDARRVDLVRQYVPRQIEQNRAAGRGGRDAHRLHDQSRNLLGAAHAVSPLRHGLCDRHLVDSRLQRVGLVVAQRTRASQK
ncbi:hypothetical protein D9M69_555070 [compost metagenome]